MSNAQNIFARTMSGSREVAPSLRKKVDHLAATLDDLAGVLGQTNKRDRQEDVSKGVDAMSAPESFEKAVARLRERDPSLSRTGAMTRARKLWPDLLDAERMDALAVEALELETAKADLAKRNAEPVRKFEAACDAAQAQVADGGRPISRLEAVRKAARAMSPEDFEAYRHALED